MKNGVLILAHGSRQPSTEETLERIAALVREKLPGTAIETAFMQFSEKNIAAGLTALIERGADEIAVVPYFLFDGVHIHEDIPAELAAFIQKNPGVKITLGKTLGADERLAEILADRVREAI